MTKKAMIKAIQLREAKAYVSLKQFEISFGEDYELAKLYRRAWCEIYELKNELGIPTDYSLPEMKEGIRLMEELDEMNRQKEALK